MSSFNDNGHNHSATDWRTKGARFVRYVTTRDKECWGFFAAGFLLAVIFA